MADGGQLGEHDHPHQHLEYPSNQSLVWDTGGGSGLDTLTVNQDVTNSGLIQAGRPAPGDNFLDHRFIINSTNSRLTNNASGTILFYPRSSSNLGDPWSIRRIDAELINDGQFTIYTHRGQIGKGIAGIDHVNNGTITLDNSMLTGIPKPQLDVLVASFTNGANGVIEGNGILNVTPLNGVVDTLQNAGELSPGLSVGTLTIQGNVNFQPGGSIFIEIDGGGAVAGVDFDQLVVTGAITGLSQADLVIDVNTALSNLVGDSLMIVTSTNDLSGFEFNSVTFTGPLEADVVYGNGFIRLENIQLFVPEPSTLAILMVGSLGLVCQTRRRNRGTRTEA